MGHVERIHTNGLELTGGEYALQDTVYIDCSADGLAKRPSASHFQSQRITTNRKILPTGIQCGLYRSCRSDL